MPVRPKPMLAAAILIASATTLGSAPAAFAQSAGASGAQEAETQSPSASAPASEAPSSTPAPVHRARRTRPPSPAMQTGESQSPTGPNTSTVQPDTSDLTGSNGASITQSQGTAPPGVAPPNGSAPDTGGGAGVDNTPNAEGGPHAP